MKNLTVLSLLLPSSAPRTTLLSFPVVLIPLPMVTGDVAGTESPQSEETSVRRSSSIISEKFWEFNKLPWLLSEGKENLVLERLGLSLRAEQSSLPSSLGGSCSAMGTLNELPPLPWVLMEEDIARMLLLMLPLLLALILLLVTESESLRLDEVLLLFLSSSALPSAWGSWKDTPTLRRCLDWINLASAGLMTWNNTAQA